MSSNTDFMPDTILQIIENYPNHFLLDPQCPGIITYLCSVKQLEIMTPSHEDTRIPYDLYNAQYLVTYCSLFPNGRRLDYSSHNHSKSIQWFSPMYSDQQTYHHSTHLCPQVQFPDLSSLSLNVSTHLYSLSRSMGDCVTTARLFTTLTLNTPSLSHDVVTYHIKNASQDK
jgi:hypothetical protein